MKSAVHASSVTLCVQRQTLRHEVQRQAMQRQMLRHVGLDALISWGGVIIDSIRLDCIIASIASLAA